MKRLSRTVFVAVLAVGMVVALAGVAIASTTAAPSGRSASGPLRAPRRRRRQEEEEEAQEEEGGDLHDRRCPASVKVGTTSLGSVLVGTDGKTLYLLDRDQGTTSVCTGGCAERLAPVDRYGARRRRAPASTRRSSRHAMQADGKDQITYAGHLLYYFSGDTAAGDTKGTAIAGWHAVSPDGTALGG